MPQIDAVTPLLQKDLERFVILARSLRHFMQDLGTLFVVVRDSEKGALESAIRRCAVGLDLRIVRESSWVPDMRSFRHLPGWYKQQLIKLAAAEFVGTEFFLTLDADVVCTRRASYEDLVPGGRARCHVIKRDEHPDWYAGAEAVLDIKSRRQQVLHNVTPCVWSRAGVLELISHLNQVAARRPYARGLRGWQQRLFFTLHRLGRYRSEPAWRGWLAASHPWAEYATYFTFLEATGRFDAYHFESDACVYDVERSIWRKNGPNRELDFEPLFRGEGPPFFVVVQSNSGLEPRDTWQKLQPFLDAPAEPGQAS